jgi:cellulose synthase/poly-beta-1,6-N-acetylglucosamine synthase-like glycosyltransferase
MSGFILKIIFFFNYYVLFYFITLNGIYFLMTILSFFTIRRYMNEYRMIKHRRVFHSSFYNPITVIAPAYNEESAIVESVKSMLQLNYPEFEIIVVNDGSSDRTLEILKEGYKLRKSLLPYQKLIPCKDIKGIYASKDYPNLVVVDKINGGKADALNAGINVAKYPLVSSIDSDSLLEPDAMLKLVRPFLDDKKTIAVGGIVRIANNCKIVAGKMVEVKLSTKWLPKFQIVEYLRAFLFGRVGLDALNSLLIISGAFGLFKKAAIVENGGYLIDSVGEDMELIIRMHRHMREKNKPYRVTFVPEPVCWTEVPETLKVLGRQRNRWHRGLIDSLWIHKKMLLNPRYGIVGLFAMPFFFFFEMLGPIVELLGYIVVPLSLYFHVINVQFAVLFFFVAFVFGIVLSLSSLVLEELSFRRYPKYSQVLQLFVCAVLENFGYRQLHAWWRFKGIIDFFKGSKQWGKMEKKGFETNV